MKFIHLSDLHLGKRVNEYSMLEDQEYILKKIINIVDAEKPDSHGGLRTSKGYTDNMLIDSCRMVVDFIASKYPGQIEEVKRLSA